MRILITIFILLFTLLYSKTFDISINGDLDDDLIIIKTTPNDTNIIELHQMHNSQKGFILYNGEKIKSNHIGGYIKFDKSFSIKDDEIYIIALANEREEMFFKNRHRTHYKSEKLLINNQILIPALLPEKNSVPNYPLWFGEDEIPKIAKQDYNYYRLFDNSIVPIAFVFRDSGDVEIELFDKTKKIYTINEHITNIVKNFKIDNLKNHPFVEVGNVLNDTDEQLINLKQIDTVVIRYKDKIYTINLPYPLMYPNLIYGVSIND